MISYAKIASLFFFCFLSISLLGQRYVSQPVANNTKYYEGYIDDINKVKLTLRCSSGNCNGDFIYLESGDRFQLQGTQANNRIELIEYDLNSNRSGYLNGRFVGNAIEATWENLERSTGNRLYLQESTNQITRFENCGDNKWIQAYRGIIGQKEVEMVLQKADNNRVLGTVYFVKSKKTASIRGELTNNGNLQLNISEESTQRLMGTLRGIYKNSQELSASFYDTKNNQSFASFELENNIGINCLEYADYFSNYDFLYPKSNDALFNQIMAFLTKNWVSECQDKARTIRQKGIRPDLRSSQRGYAWTEVVLYKDYFLSGLLSYNNSWNGEKATKSFNYDFSNRASIELEDIFKNKFDYKSYIKDYIEETLKKDNNFSNDIGFKAWVAEQDFSLFTLGRNGLYFFTDFHIVYGRQKILLPYKKIKSNIKRKSSIKRLIKK